MIWFGFSGPNGCGCKQPHHHPVHVNDHHHSTASPPCVVCFRWKLVFVIWSFILSVSTATGIDFSLL